MTRRNLLTMTAAGMVALLLMAACNLGTPIRAGGGGTDVGGISGVLVDDGGTPVGAAKVRVVPVDANGLGKSSDMAIPMPDSTTTNAAGNFSLTGLAAGTYNLVALVTRDNTTLGIFIEGIVVVGGQASTNIGERTLDPAASITIEIRDGEGPLLQGALCALQGTPFTAVSDTTGSCDFAALPPGTFSLTVSHPDLQFTVSGQLAALPGLVDAISLSDIISGGSQLAPPVLAVPMNGDTLTDTVATFFWTPVAGATGFHMQIADDTTFSAASLQYNDSMLISYNVYVAHLEAGSTQYWRIRATTPQGTGEWSERWSYTTPIPSQQPPVPNPVSTPAAPVNLKAMLATSEGNTATVIVSWEHPVSIGKAPGSGTFVARTPEGEMCHAPGSQTSCAINGLSWDVEYTFSAVSINPLGLGDTSTGITITPALLKSPAYTNDTDSTVTDTFAVSTPPSPPTPVTPENGATGVESSVLLMWTVVDIGTGIFSADPAYYILQVFTDTTLIPGSLVQQDTMLIDTLRPLTLSSGTTYYWRVSAQSSQEATGWSPFWSFTTAGSPPPPDPPTPGVAGLISPAPYAVTDESPVLTWSNTENTSWYRVQVAPDTLFTSLVANDSVHETSHTVGPLDPGEYFWRVRAFNAHGSTTSWGSSFVVME